MKRKKLFLILILVIAGILRIYRLDSYPALNADEAAIGYNAYSLIQTGKDEHGNSWPIHFQSFNDYKPGLYFYIVLPFVKLMGLTELAVRLPGAILGICTVLIVYFLVKELAIGDWRLQILSSLFLAISPWHIHFSRGGWEVNVATFFIVLGICLFIRGLKSIWYLLFSVVSFSLSLYAYHAARVVVPLLGLGLVVIYWKGITKNIKKYVLVGLVGLVLLTPLVVDFTRSNIASRAVGVGLFADTGPIERTNEQRGEHENYQSLMPRVLHNKVVNYGLTFLKNWFDHFHGEFLFLSGDVIQRNRVPETGQMYLFDMFFLLVGLVVVMNKYFKRWSFILMWLLVAPIAAALTFQSPHALRSQNMVIPLVIISAYGVVNIIDWLKKQNRLVYVIGGFVVMIVVFWQFVRYQHMYWVHMAKDYPFSSQYGLRELVSYVDASKREYKQIIVSDSYDQPYILFLFYLKYPPEKFQKEHTLTLRDQYGFSTVREFDIYRFRDVSDDVIKFDNPNSLIAGTGEEIPVGVKIVDEIYGSNGFRYFQIVENY